MTGNDRDLTAETGAETDVARLGRAGAPPQHEKTADEDFDAVDWNKVAASPAFQALTAARARFVVPATIFFIVYYFALLVLVGFFPEFMSWRVLGPLNLAYLFALSQFAMTGVLAVLYLRQAGRFDAQAAAIRSAVSRRGGR